MRLPGVASHCRRSSIRRPAAALGLAASRREGKRADTTGTRIVRGRPVTACTTDVEGSAGYVAMELVEATLSGRQGSFVLQHIGINGDGTHPYIFRYELVE